jgi:hypothetical protein
MPASVGLPDVLGAVVGVRWPRDPESGPRRPSEPWDQRHRVGAKVAEPVVRSHDVARSHDVVRSHDVARSHDVVRSHDVARSQDLVGRADTGWGRRAVDGRQCRSIPGSRQWVMGDPSEDLAEIVMCDDNRCAATRISVWTMVLERDRASR